VTFGPEFEGRVALRSTVLLTDAQSMADHDPVLAVLPLPSLTGTIDGHEAWARVAHRLSEVIAIYPNTPSSTVGELADAWSSEGRRTVDLRAGSD
jgi:hypothetical protein